MANGFRPFKVLFLLVGIIMANNSLGAPRVALIVDAQLDQYAKRGIDIISKAGELAKELQNIAKLLKEGLMP